MSDLVGKACSSALNSASALRVSSVCCEPWGSKRNTAGVSKLTSEAIEAAGEVEGS